MNNVTWATTNAETMERTASGWRKTRTESTPRPLSGFLQRSTRLRVSLSKGNIFPIRRTPLPLSYRQAVLPNNGLVFLINHRLPTIPNRKLITTSNFHLISTLTVIITAASKAGGRTSDTLLQNHQDALSLHRCRHDHRHGHVSCCPLLPRRRLRFRTPDPFSRHGQRYVSGIVAHPADYLFLRTYVFDLAKLSLRLPHFYILPWSGRSGLIAGPRLIGVAAGARAVALVGAIVDGVDVRGPVVDTSSEAGGDPVPSSERARTLRSLGSLGRWGNVGDGGRSREGGDNCLLHSYASFPTLGSNYPSFPALASSCSSTPPPSGFTNIPLSPFSDSRGVATDVEDDRPTVIKPNYQSSARQPSGWLDWCHQFTLPCGASQPLTWKSTVETPFAVLHQ
ncbi:hypothetical protein QBC45DRAFT_185481 [Copromyces sp. CBS 386.78]|nr:hypothetical protein QBC45DRAFT_185481 [Copromyces sp. CBS 386.78]